MTASGGLAEITGEAPDLAAAELCGALEAVEGREAAPGLLRSSPRWIEIPPDLFRDPDRVAARLALTRRLLRPLPAAAAPRPRQPGEGAAFRRLGHPSSGAGDPLVRAAAQAWREAGGRIRLGSPDRRFWYVEETGGWAEEVALVPRSALWERRPSRLPFHRPVTLDPRWARALANLARIRPGDRVVDPFAGTGALLAEAALLGARTVAVDVDPDMIRGLLANFRHLGLAPEAAFVGDAREAAEELGGSLDALLTDLPYGRASGLHAQDLPSLVTGALAAWVGRIRPGGYVAWGSPVRHPPLPDPIPPFAEFRLRVHRSLTRRFAVARVPPAAGFDARFRP